MAVPCVSPVSLSCGAVLRWLSPVVSPEVALMLRLSAALWACHVVAVMVSVLGGCLVGLSCGGAAVVAFEWQLSCIGCLIVHVVTVLWGCPVVDNLASFLG